MATTAFDAAPREPQPLDVRGEDGEPVEVKRTYCKICMVGCGLEVEVAGGERIVGVRGDRQHPLSHGYTCPKGRATGRNFHVDQAITRPLMRKHGALVEVSWDEALDDIGARLRRVIDSHGPHAVGMYFGSGLGLDSAGYMMEEAFHQALGGPPKFTPLTNDGTAKAMLAGAMAGFHGINPKTDYDAATLVIYVGTNPMVSHGHNTGMVNPATFIRAVADRGEVWTIDPLFTETAKFSTRHIAPFPGKDHAILAWLVREVIDGGPLQPSQPVVGLDELRAVLDGMTRARAAAIAGVGEAALDDLLAAVRRHGRLAIETGTGVTMAASANMTQWFAWLLAILTGSMNAPGGMWMHPGVLFPFDTFEYPLIDSAFTPGPKTRPEIKGILGEWPCAVLPPEIEAGNIRALFNFGGSILRSFPDVNALRAALPKLDLHVATEIVANESTALCTHVLPTKSALERHEFTRWDTLNWTVNLQYSEPLVAPVGERRSAWWAIAQFMKRADLPVPNYLPESDRVDGADEVMLQQLMGMARCGWDELKQKRFVEFERELPAPWVQRHFERFGGWRLAVPEIMAQWRQVCADDEAALGQPRPLVYIPRRQRRKLNAQLGFLGDQPDLLIAPETAAELGVADGQRVRVHNKAGELVLIARHDAKLRPGLVSIPHGHLDANVNLLTSTADVDPLGGMVLYGGVPVEIEPLAGA